MNDGKCDPKGRFWAGSMSHDLSEPNGALFRLDPDFTVTKVLDGVTISNGLDWTDDGRTLFYVDTLALYLGPTSGVDAFDFDMTAGLISNRRRVFDIPNVRTGPVGHCGPDGLTLDADGFLWVAVVGAGEVRRFTPAGELDAVVEMPVACPTSVTFGGDDLGDLYITTMTLEAAVPEPFRTPHPAWTQPHHGAIFRCRPGVAGRPASIFAG
jgi:sugar lactone lactonase YvrE